MEESPGRAISTKSHFDIFVVVVQSADAAEYSTLKACRRKAYLTEFPAYPPVNKTELSFRYEQDKT